MLSLLDRITVSVSFSSTSILLERIASKDGSPQCFSQSRCFASSATTVIGYLSDVKKGPKDLQRVRLEISSVLTILIMLQDQADQAKEDDSFSSTLRALNVPDGPFTQFHATMQRLASKVSPVQSWKTIRKAFEWHFEKEQIYEILDTIERQKTLFNLARKNDHIALSKAMGSDIELIYKGVNEISLGVTDIQIDERRKGICQ